MVRKLEETEEIRCELEAPCKKKAKHMYLPEKSVKLRRKTPTVLTTPLSQAQARKRRAELFEAACQIHGGRNETNCRTPG